MVTVRTIDIKLDHTSYKIYLEANLFSKMGEEVKKIYKGKKIVIVTDSNVNTYYGDSLVQRLEEQNYPVQRLVLQPGEKTKCMESLMGLYNHFLDFCTVIVSKDAP